MSYFSDIKAWFRGEWEREPGRSGPRIIIVGDSHTAAIKRARDFEERAHVYSHIEVIRFRIQKGEGTLGEVDFDDFCRRISRFTEDDMIFSVIGGNQYAVISTVRNPVDFYFLESSVDDNVVSDKAQLLPNRALRSYLEPPLRIHVVGPVEQMQKLTKARVFHILPPPPKADNEFICNHFETRFVEEGIAELGPSRPKLRLKCWEMQRDILVQICDEAGIATIPPPPEAVTEDGFLAEPYYANDVTHGNRRYGELVLKQVLEIAGPAADERNAA